MFNCRLFSSNGPTTKSRAIDEFVESRYALDEFVGRPADVLIELSRRSLQFPVLLLSSGFRSDGYR